MTAAEMGASDGARWRGRLRSDYTALQAACAAGEGHWKRIDKGELGAEDAQEYGTAFLRAALPADEQVSP